MKRENLNRREAVLACLSGHDISHPRWEGRAIYYFNKQSKEFLSRRPDDQMHCSASSWHHDDGYFVVGDIVEISREDESHQSHPWTMPSWMERFCGTPLLSNKGKEDVENLVADKSNVQVNAWRAMIALVVKTQVDSLYELYRRGEIS